MSEKTQTKTPAVPEKTDAENTIPQDLTYKSSHADLVAANFNPDTMTYRLQYPIRENGTTHETLQLRRFTMKTTRQYKDDPEYDYKMTRFASNMPEDAFELIDAKDYGALTEIVSHFL